MFHLGALKISVDCGEVIAVVNQRSTEIAHAIASISNRLGALEAAFATIQQQEQTIMADLTALTQSVAKTTDVEQSAIVLLQGLSAQIESLKTDPAALQGLADQLNAKADELAAAVTTNTPSA